MIVIGITGTLGAGKGTVVEYLIKHKNFKHYSISDYLKSKLLKSNKEINRTNLQDIGNEIREKYGPSYIAEQLFVNAQKNGIDTIIESIRNPKEAEFIKSKGGKMLAVTADQKIRYERIKLRKSEKDDVTFEEFQKQEEKEFQNTDPNAQNLPKCIEMSDIIITNNESLEKLYEQIKNKI